MTCAYDMASGASRRAAVTSCYFFGLRAALGRSARQRCPGMWRRRFAVALPREPRALAGSRRGARAQPWARPSLRPARSTARRTNESGACRRASARPSPVPPRRINDGRASHDGPSDDAGGGKCGRDQAPITKRQVTRCPPPRCSREYSARRTSPGPTRSTNLRRRAPRLAADAVDARPRPRTSSRTRPAPSASGAARSPATPVGGSDGVHPR